MPTGSARALALIVLALVSPTPAAGAQSEAPTCWQEGHVPSYVFLARADSPHSSTAPGIFGADAARLFAKSGVALTSDHLDAVLIEDDRIIYGGVGVATTFHDIEITNVIGQNSVPPLPDGSNWVSYTLTFAQPVKAVAFERVPLIAGPNGTIHPEWVAVARGVDGAIVATARQGLIQTYVHVDARMFFLEGTDGKLIRSVTFAGNHHGRAAYANVVIDALLWCS